MQLPTSFESDLQAQPEALLTLVASGEPPGLVDIRRSTWAHVVFAGMGSSYIASLPTWRRTAAMCTAWTLDAGQLLDAPGFLRPDTLLVLTSQSGSSGEVVELLRRLGSAGWPRPRTVVGVTADESSPLARESDLVLPLHSGEEATVSAKSYLNSLATHRRIAAALLGEPDQPVLESVAAAAKAVEDTIREADVSCWVDALARPDCTRSAAVGWGSSAASALYHSLTVKEAAKVANEGYIGGAFRHGPIELAGPELTLSVFAQGREALAPREVALLEDLETTGTTLVVVGGSAWRGPCVLETRGADELATLATSAVLAQLVAIGVAKARGLEPGTFLHGSKVTKTL